jgi:hypothetical protein
MTTTRARIGVLVPWALTVGLFVGLVGALALATLTPEFMMDAGTAGFLGLVSAWALAQATVGAAISWRRPGHTIGRLLQLTGPLMLLVFYGFLLGALRFIAYGAGDLVGGIAAWLALVGIIPMIFLAFPMLGILFPDGRLPSPAFRWPLGIVGAMVGLGSASFAFVKGQLNEGLPANPFGLIELSPDLSGILSAAGTLGIVGALGLAVAGVVVRWRRGSAIARAQLKWLIAALTIGAVTFGPSFASSETDVLDLLALGSGLLLPVAIGIAVLRYRLYEIDRLISRTLSWALVSGSLVVIFATAVVALQALLAGATQGQTLAVAASTLVAAALFQPLRARVQRVVDRRFDRARYDAQRTADRFAEGVRNEVDLGALRMGLIAVAMEAVRPGGAGVWLRPAAVREDRSP